MKYFGELPIDVIVTKKEKVSNYEINWNFYILYFLLIIVSFLAVPNESFTSYNSVLQLSFQLYEAVSITILIANQIIVTVIYFQSRVQTCRK